MQHYELFTEKRTVIIESKTDMAQTFYLLVHIVNSIRFKMVYTPLSRSLFLYFNYLVSVTAGGPVSPRGHM